MIDRRTFLTTALIAAAGAHVARAAWPAIKLSLSGRISEPIGEVTNLKPLTYDEFLHIAKTTGYDAVCFVPAMQHCDPARPNGRDGAQDSGSRLAGIDGHLRHGPAAQQ